MWTLGFKQRFIRTEIRDHPALNSSILWIEEIISECLVHSALKNLAMANPPTCYGP